MKRILLSALTALSAVSASHSILNYGIVTPGSDITLNEEIQNTGALETAMLAANRSSTDRTVVIPKGLVVSMMPVHLTNLTDIRLDIQGDLLATKRYKNWTIYGGKGDESSEDNKMKHVPFLWF